jgi:hypothetical protein
MSARSSFHVCFFVTLLLLAACDSIYGSSLSGFPITLWKKSDTWRITVQLYPKEKPAASQGPPDFLSIHVTVVGTQKVGASDCWKVFFIPDKEGQKMIGQSYCVMVDKETAWPRKVIRVKDPCIATVEQRGEASVVIGAPKGFPLEIFPLVNLQEFRAEGLGTTLKLTKRGAGNDILVEAAYKSVKGDEVVIRQRWGEGETWWRDYERFVNGRKDLHARRGTAGQAATPPGSGKPDGPIKVQSPETKGGPDLFYLRRDPRLQVKLNLVAKDPTVGELLDRLVQATGLKLTLDPSLSAHQPTYGEIEIRNGPAFSVMEIMEKRGLEGGRWEQVEDGYRLVGRSTALAKISPKVWHPLVWWASAVLGLALSALGLLFFIWRRGAQAKGRQTAPPASTRMRATKP